MKSEPKWISKKSALAFHEALLAEHGGAQGIVSEHLLDSALASPQNHFAYGSGADLFELAAVYARALTQDHPFVDGNKRVALTVTFTFLERNGVLVTGTEAEAAEMVLGLAAEEVNAETFAQWLRDNSEVARRERTPIKRITRAVATKKRGKKK